MKKLLCFAVSFALLLFGCGMPGKVRAPLKPYDDIRYIKYVQEEVTFGKADYCPEDIPTYTFNVGTILQGNEKTQTRVLEGGKNPGLGIRALHAQGITGEGVNVAIIDQNLLLDHPEFSGHIAAYHDTGYETPENEGSMHAPAVASLLVGQDIGTAPGARLYFAAAPSWNGDSGYYAHALYWIIDQNKALPAGQKIRAVSISAAPSGKGSPFRKNHKLYDEAVSAAQAEGILVLDCRTDTATGFIHPAFYDPADPEAVEKCKGGFPDYPSDISPGAIGVPCSHRTVAEEYFAGEHSYQYTGSGGLSWGIPYAAGVLAIGWQVNPSLTNDEILDLLMETAYVDEQGSAFIDPQEFIEAVRASA